MMSLATENVYLTKMLSRARRPLLCLFDGSQAIVAKINDVSWWLVIYGSL